MVEGISKDTIRQALAQVTHPEIKGRNLVELGMIPGITVNGNQVRVTLALPFQETSIKDDLVNRVREAVSTLNGSLGVDVRLTQMSQRERAAFMSYTGEGPAQAEILNDIARVLAVMSGKGGVGKSSVAGMLAVALRRKGHSVGVLDADITGPSIPKMFGIHKHPVGGPIGIMPVDTKTGLKLMSINLLLPSETQAVVWRGPLISKAIRQFWSEIFWGTLDYLVVDLPPGTSDAALTVMQAIPLSGVLLVTSPQDLAGMVVRKAAGMVELMGAPLLGVVENMSYTVCPKCGTRIDIFGPSQAEKTAHLIGAPLLGRIPLEPDFAVHCDAGTIEDYPATAFETIVEQIIERVPDEKVKPAFAR